MSELAEPYSRTRVWQIYECLYPRPPDLVDGNRFFVREGELLVWSEKDKKKKERSFFLFNDLLLLCKKEGSKKYWLRIHVTLRSQVAFVEDSGSYDPLEFRLRCRTRTFLFWALSPESKKSWMQDLDASIKGKHEVNAKRLEIQKKFRIDANKPKLEPLKPIKSKVKNDTVPALPPPPGKQRKRSATSVSQTVEASTPPPIPPPIPPPSMKLVPPTSNLIDLLDFDPFAQTNTFLNNPTNDSTNNYMNNSTNPFSQTPLYAQSSPFQDNPTQVFEVRSATTPTYVQSSAYQNPFSGDQVGYQMQAFDPGYTTVQVSQGFPSTYVQNQNF
eukprot:TRINITY_DN6203_c0_g1_i1.p1 TRINITY_DN6203_c0_g1~~TRINITY_DN6203_c0_g1_i1.p1  ORF type:complete len:329 (-),score=54.13 TRINITY_DN6203_c0_g1_i1:41-1027(-)